MHALRRFRAESSPLLLVALWLLLDVAAILAVRLPGPENPTYGADTLGGAVLGMVVFGVFVFLGVRLAWWLAIYVQASAVLVACAVFAIDPHPKPLLMGALLAAGFWLIWSGAVEDYMHGDRRARPARLH